LVGCRLGHYQVIERLGGGGMGEVYVAEDRSLNRRVALKVPRPGIADSVDHRERFQREARATAALNHPNIVHVYSVDESDGLLYLTMELVEGRSLREILRDEAPLPVTRAVAFAAQMADGLASAHAAGVLHRDLKPGNVMITADDRVKILDFGLAKFFAPDAASNPDAITMAGDASSAGLALGTAGYMSPEQALGRQLDPRSDLFALGTVLYEMTTGRPPFEGETLPALFDQLLNRPPRSPRAVNPSVPVWLAAIIDRTLEKDPDRRFASAHDVLRALGGAGHSGALSARASRATPVDPAPASSIVVLPFVDLSPAKDHEYFCHGITEEIINSLATVPGVRVISRTSAFAFQGQPLEITDIGRRLLVGRALEGSVRRAGDRVRVTAQLADTTDGRQLWSKRFDRDLSDVFAIQDEIAAAIVEELRSGVGVGPVSRGPTRDSAAHDAYLQAMYERNTWTEAAMRRAIAGFRAAIARDPAFASAYAGLAEAYVWLYSGVGVLPAQEAIPHARLAVDAALELDPTLTEAHRIRGLIAMHHDWDGRTAREALARALELGPGSAAARLWNAWRLVLLERQYDQALTELGEVERLDPLDVQAKAQIGYVHHFRHDHDRALAQFERVVALQPSFAFGHYALGDAWLARGAYPRAIAAFARAVELGGRSATNLAALGHAYGRSGNQAMAREILGELTARTDSGYVAPMWIALVHLGLGDLERLFEWMSRAVEARDGSLLLITAAVEFDPVRPDPRFTSVLERMGLGHLASPARGQRLKAQG
jgi:serine/threonine-protein kinase